ncbi:MAG: hypothetical protein ACTSYH_05820 [Candidatus Heimdallarchaeaceae archaeon]
MDLKELQEKIKKADEDRGWDISLLSQTFTHLIEEMGEIGRHILFRDGYKTSNLAKEVDDEEFGKELADAIIFLIKIANAQDIDLDKIVQKKANKNWDERFPVDECLKDSKEYLNRQQKILDDFKKRLK